MWPTFTEEILNGKHHFLYSDISRETYERNDIEKVVDNDGIFWLNEKDTEEGLDLREICEKFQ